MKLKLPGDSREFEVEIIAREGRAVRVRVNGEELSAQVEPTAIGTVVRLGDKTALTLAAKVRNSILVAVGPAQFEFVTVEAAAKRRGHALSAHEITAPMPGKVLKLLVTEGQKVAAGAPLITLEAMKMETTLFAEGPALIAKILVEPGEMVDHGAVLVELSPPPLQSGGPSAPESGPQAD